MDDINSSETTENTTTTDTGTTEQTDNAESSGASETPHEGNVAALNKLKPAVEKTLNEKLKERAEAVAKPGTKVPGGVITPTGEYVPNYKFRVKDKELEFDDAIKKVIKDKETEERIRDLYAKGYGIDEVKASRETIREKLQKTEQSLSKFENVVRTASTFAQKKDYHSYFKFLDIPEDDILRYAYERVQYREMDPAQRAQIDGHYDANRRAFALEQQNQQLQSQSVQAMQQAKQLEVNYELAKPEVLTAAQTYDARIGKPGAFFEAVRERGELHWNRSGVDIPASQAIQEVLMISGLASPAPNAQGQANAQMGTTPQVNPTGTSQVPAQANKQIIPNIRGSGTSPVKKVYRSIEELRKVAKQKAREV